MSQYAEIIDFLYNHLPMFQRSGPAAYKNSLDNTLQLDQLYGSPHRRFATIHVAGTNGKGSVSHMLAAVLQAAGYRTGLYTSPHLKDFRERIRINGAMIPQEEVVSWVSDFRQKNLALALEPSFFELTVALAFDFFARQQVEIAVVEVGLGGRLDSTNIITPEVSIITNISYDHTNLLGETLPLIAAEKAGIIKPGRPVVVSQTQPDVQQVFTEKARQTGSPIFFADQEFSATEGLLGLDGKQIFQFYQGKTLRYPDLRCDLPGIYQQLNLPAVLKTIDLLTAQGWNIPPEAVYRGLADVTGSTGLQGRWQVLGANPRVVCDTGHNEDGIRQVVRQIEQTPHQKLHIVFGTVADKDPSKVLALLPRQAHYYFTRAQLPRALDENRLREQAAAFGLAGKAFPTVKQAVEAAKAQAGPNDLIFIGGSTFVVAEIL